MKEKGFSVEKKDFAYIHEYHTTMIWTKVKQPSSLSETFTITSDQAPHKTPGLIIHEQEGDIFHALHFSEVAFFLLVL